MTRREIALAHHRQVLEQDKGNIVYSVEHSVIYDDNVSSVSVRTQNMDCLTAALYLQEVEHIDESWMTILNFASFTQPGGGYLAGAMAQEESLCSESNLWEILNSQEFDLFYDYNSKHKNNGLYENRAIFTPDVMFTRDGKNCFCNVLTCASPNYNHAISCGISHDEIVEVYRNRLKFMYDILRKEYQGMFIAGAWGCGVFGFPRELSQQLFKEIATIDTVLAIPNDPKFKPRPKC